MKGKNWLLRGGNYRVLAAVFALKFALAGCVLTNTQVKVLGHDITPSKLEQTTKETHKDLGTLCDPSTPEEYGCGIGAEIEIRY